MEFLFFLIAIAVGAIATWQIFTWRYGSLKKRKQETLQSESHILLERMEKVFKVVLAEGYFTEIYDHSSRKDFWGLFEANKKALIVAKAKVSIGFDFSKMKWRFEEGQKKIFIEHFPEAEVLSIDPEYKFYDINHGLLHKFNPDDYTKIITEAKSLMLQKAVESDLPTHANRQIGLMMQQISTAMGWEMQLNNADMKDRQALKNAIKGNLPT